MPAGSLGLARQWKAGSYSAKLADLEAEAQELVVAWANCREPEYECFVRMEVE